MLHSIAKVATALNVDGMANTVVERLYTNSRTVNPRFSRRFQILSYHKVSTDEHPFFEPVHPTTFDAQMDFLKKCYRVMPLQELFERSRKGNVPDRAVAITFDDGYRDNYTFAFPILKKYGLPATIFVATGAIETGDAIWHDRVFDAFRFATVRQASLRDGSVAPLSLETDDTRNRSLESVLVRAKGLYGTVRREFVEDVEDKLKPAYPRDPERRMLNWTEIREMHQAGIEFGSHTVSHTILSRMPQEEMVKELHESKQQLSEQLRAPVTSFAYPNGKFADYNQEAKAVLKDCGYSLAVTCEQGFNHVLSDAFELRRGQPWQKQIEIFRLKFFLQRHGLAS